MSLNTTIYLFGKATGENKTFQYPIDYTREIFQQYTLQPEVSSQIVLYRRDQLVYHLYYKRVTNGYIGLCLLLNGAWITGDKKELLETYENAIAVILSNNTILKINNQGNVVLDTTCVFDKNSYILLEDLVNNIQTSLSSTDHLTLNLPPIDPSIPSSITKDNGTNPWKKQWVEAMGKYRSIIGQYSDSNEYNGLSPFLKKIKQLIEEKEHYLKECEKLKAQKEHYAWIIVLMSILFIGALVAVGVIVNKNNLINTQRVEMDDLSQRIENKDQEIANLELNTRNLNRQITVLKESIAQKDLQLERASRTADSLDSIANVLSEKISQLSTQKAKLAKNLERSIGTSPIKITSILIGNADEGSKMETEHGGTIYSSNTMFLEPKIHYTCYESGYYTLKIRLYTPSGCMSKGNSSPDGYSFEKKMYFEKGEHHMRLNGWGGKEKGHWKSGEYRFEIWMEGTYLASKSLKIY